MKWKEQKMEVQRCALALRRANEEGKELSPAVFAKMAKFSVEEIEAIEAYLFYVSEGGGGADYMTTEDMNQK